MFSESQTAIRRGAEAENGSTTSDSHKENRQMRRQGSTGCTVIRLPAAIWIAEHRTREMIVELCLKSMLLFSSQHIDGRNPHSRRYSS